MLSVRGKHGTPQLADPGILDFSDSRGQIRQLGDIAVEQGELGKVPVGDLCAERSADGIKQRCCRRDLYDLRDGAYLEGIVEVRLIADAQNNVRPFFNLESLRLDRGRVGGRGE